MKDTLVAVLWDDVRVDQADMFTRDEILRARGVPFTTFGILVRDDHEMVSVASEVCENGSFRGITHILRPLVKHVTPLGTWPPKKRRERKKKVAPSLTVPTPAAPAPPATVDPPKAQ
jgi:hypothetical protein